MGKDVIIACDFPSGKQCLDFLDIFQKNKPFVKIGMELFYAEGPSIIQTIKKRGHKIFLDLKMHDIPNTVASTIAVLAKLKVDLINVHASGTSKMLEASAERIKNIPNRPLLLAVTQLTSTSEEELQKDLLINSNMQDTVVHYANLAKNAGLDGVICSPLESPLIHESCGKGFLTVTPGVRFEQNDLGDQKRVTTPEQALHLGSDYIVMGRPITRAQDPLTVYQKAVNDFVKPI